MIPLQFESIDQLTENIATFWFKPTQPIMYEPGQFIELHLPHDSADERGDSRMLSLSSSPTEALLAITTNFSSQGGSSFKRKLQQLQPHDALNITQPMGDFVLPRNVATPLVFIAGGLGATPLRSMVKSLTDKNQKRDIYMFYGASSEDNLCFTHLFQSYCKTFETVLSRPSPNWNGTQGRLHVQHIRQTLNSDIYNTALFYIAGPERFVEAIYQQCLDNGIPHRRIAADYFHGYDT